MDTKVRYCAQYITKSGRRVPCDRPCVGAFYCSLHGGHDAWIMFDNRGLVHPARAGIEVPAGRSGPAGARFPRHARG